MDILQQDLKKKPFSEICNEWDNKNNPSVYEDMNTNVIFEKAANMPTKDLIMQLRAQFPDAKITGNAKKEENSKTINIEIDGKKYELNSHEQDSTCVKFYNMAKERERQKQPKKEQEEIKKEPTFRTMSLGYVEHGDHLDVDASKDLPKEVKSFLVGLLDQNAIGAKDEYVAELNAKEQKEQDAQQRAKDMTFNSSIMAKCTAIGVGVGVLATIVAKAAGVDLGMEVGNGAIAGMTIGATVGAIAGNAGKVKVAYQTAKKFIAEHLGNNITLTPKESVNEIGK